MYKAYDLMCAFENLFNQISRLSVTIPYALSQLLALRLEVFEFSHDDIFFDFTCNLWFLWRSGILMSEVDDAELVE